MTIDVATGIARILKQEGVGWVSTFPVCRVNNALGREGVPMLMMRDDRYAVAVAGASLSGAVRASWIAFIVPASHCVAQSVRLKSLPFNPATAAR